MVQQALTQHNNLQEQQQQRNMTAAAAAAAEFLQQRGQPVVACPVDLAAALGLICTHHPELLHTRSPKETHRRTHAHMYHVGQLDIDCSTATTKVCSSPSAPPLPTCSTYANSASISSSSTSDSPSSAPCQSPAGDTTHTHDKGGGFEGLGEWSGVGGGEGGWVGGWGGGVIHTCCYVSLCSAFVILPHRQLTLLPPCC